MIGSGDAFSLASAWDVKRIFFVFIIFVALRKLHSSV